MDTYDETDKGAWFMFKSSFDIKTDWWYLTLAVWINQKKKNFKKWKHFEESF